MEKNVSSVAEQDKTAEVKKNPKLIELARPYKFDDKEYTEIDLSGLDDLTIKDAVLIIKKLYNEGEMAVMITPETATAYTDALAAAATKLPIEFFQLLPIGASKKVRQTVQASLRSAAAEEDGDEDEHSHIMKFGKPYTYKGEKYTEVDLSGVANFTGMNVRQAENRMEEEDIRAAHNKLTKLQGKLKELQKQKREEDMEGLYCLVKESGLSMDEVRLRLSDTAAASQSLNDDIA